jgi:hypothetical protein
MALRIQRILLEEPRRHGEHAYPHEGCDALVGEFDVLTIPTVQLAVDP